MGAGASGMAITGRGAMDADHRDCHAPLAKGAAAFTQMKVKVRSTQPMETVILGAYESRWAPCAPAHEPEQGQLP